jgi:cell division protein FtsI/penicillin-binding protein 2
MDVNNSKAPSKFAGKKLRLTVIIVVVAIIIFAMWLFFISVKNNPYYDNGKLPPNCYSINGKQVCPNP